MGKDIKIKNLKKSFNRKGILNIPELTFRNGGISYLLGENGAGKSTLLNILAKIDRDYQGRIDDSFSEEEISLVDANPYMLKGDVYKNIAYPLKIRKRVNIEKRMEDLLEIFNLKALKNKEASKLSSGETQKVAIVRALSFSPKLLMLDEPTANLDKGAKLELIDILKKYNQGGTTIIVVTHDHSFFENLKGEKIVLEKLGVE
ncbi:MULTISPECIES: ATP-binding cassette domain-containing protein [Psychrilyobacter]|uniref:ATP-binding cassette domain-containing protein n=1 Tax=Psychrilyobacter piezotolerans TaxID=2293438 RepID=A0ABX9KLD8_9FUSO|nr:MULTISPECIES: ATP-binding cassette domain-containing protein [Psychrilyobacter]MCS5422294.1 ATP-binding cassette domain-containing protein [Psychrilyobacter sp. S5]NDI76494.1 ATP-binding cassette domain-containing protein [Psychrilyobacter piezotolerans]RDE66086.1 ATP-binding cassette domain-containing protein [Psychrilyobacter sp. S5]REI43264.1 ATP-binding cassette domain-containing protein [Psychrilyobacter piezotolerans]